MKSIFLTNISGQINYVYEQGSIELLKNIASLDEKVYKKEDILANPDSFKDVRFIFSTWGMPTFSQEEIKNIFPSLECVFYGAGSVQSFARPFINSGVKVFSAWAANAVPVAEYTVAQIILANKGFYATSR